METAKVIGKKDGKLLHIANGSYRTIISGSQTEGRYAVIEMNVPPGAGPAPHAHNDVDEMFYVASGEVEFRTEYGDYLAKAGDTIRIPLDGGIHAFKNKSQHDTVLICTVHPAGFEAMFEEIGAVGPTGAKAIVEKYGNQLFPPDYFDSKENR